MFVLNLIGNAVWLGMECGLRTRYFGLQQPFQTCSYSKLKRGYSNFNRKRRISVECVHYDIFQTASFATLLLVLAVLPVVLIYGPETDSFGGLAHVLLAEQDQLKVADPLARQLFVNFFGAVFGAWVGAFPIPLDWVTFSGILSRI